MSQQASEVSLEVNVKSVLFAKKKGQKKSWKCYVMYFFSPSICILPLFFKERVKGNGWVGDDMLCLQKILGQSLRSPVAGLINASAWDRGGLKDCLSGWGWVRWANFLPQVKAASYDQKPAQNPTILANWASLPPEALQILTIAWINGLCPNQS